MPACLPACLAWPSRRAAAFCPSLGVIGAAGKGLHLLPRPRIGPRFVFWTSQRPWSKPWSTSERRALSSGGHFHREGTFAGRAHPWRGHLRREGTYAGRELSPGGNSRRHGHFRREGTFAGRGWVTSGAAKMADERVLDERRRMCVAQRRARVARDGREHSSALRGGWCAWRAARARRDEAV